MRAAARRANSRSKPAGVQTIKKRATVVPRSAGVCGTPPSAKASSPTPTFVSSRPTWTVAAFASTSLSGDVDQRSDRCVPASQQIRGRTNNRGRGPPGLYPDGVDTAVGDEDVLRMITIEFSAADLLRCRFAISPVAEVFHV